jgi:hypothetical protein
MASRFFKVPDEQMFVRNEAAVSQNAKKATTFCLTVCMSILKLFLVNKITKSLHVNTVSLATSFITIIRELKYQIVLKTFSSFLVIFVIGVREGKNQGLGAE